jgi:hypothetical protein
MRNRRIALLAALALLMVTAVRHPSAELRIQLHDPADIAPHRVQAAVELGVIAVSVLVTWTSHRLVS